VCVVLSVGRAPLLHCFMNLLCMGVDANKAAFPEGTPEDHISSLHTSSNASTEGADSCRALSETPTAPARFYCTGT
jgi:hypothetical protein